MIQRRPNLNRINEKLSETLDVFTTTMAEATIGGMYAYSFTLTTGGQTVAEIIPNQIFTWAPFDPDYLVATALLDKL